MNQSGSKTGRTHGISISSLIISVAIVLLISIIGHNEVFGQNIFSQPSVPPPSTAPWGVGIGSALMAGGLQKPLHINTYQGFNWGGAIQNDPAIRISYGASPTSVELSYGHLALITLQNNAGGAYSSIGTFNGSTNYGDFVLQASVKAEDLILTTRNENGNIRFATTPNAGGNDVERMTIAPIGTVKISNLAGTGTRMVIADATGLLSTQAIPGAGSGWGLTGNAALPTDFLGTTNTNPLVLKVNSSEKMRILSSGYVGIGNNNPSVALDVIGSTKISTLAGAGTRMVVANASGLLSTQVAPPSNPWVLNGNALTGSEFIGSTNNYAFRIRTNNLETMTIIPTTDPALRSGYVGIGTGGPSNPGDVNGPNNLLDVRGTISSGGTNFGMSPITSFDGTLTLYPSDQGSWFHVDNRAGNGLSISHGRIPGSCWETTSPHYRLDQVGATDIMSFYGYRKNVGIGCNPLKKWTGNKFTVRCQGQPSRDYYFEAAGQEALLTVSDTWYPTVEANDSTLYNEPHTIALRVERRNQLPSDTKDYKLISAGHNAAETFKVWGNGKVEIGDKVPENIRLDNGYKLSVDGTIVAKELIVRMTNWADYVFNNDYKLLNLDQVDQYIKANGHLPGLPTTAEVNENGVAVGEIQSKLLEKIEELTLYMIELKKENAQIKLENDEIKKKLNMK